MKKFITMMMIMLMGAFVFTSCSKDSVQDIDPTLKSNVSITTTLIDVNKTVNLKQGVSVYIPEIGDVKVIIQWNGKDISGNDFTGYKVQSVEGYNNSTTWNFDMDRGTYRLRFRGYYQNDNAYSDLTDSNAKDVWIENDKFTFYGTLNDSIILTKNATDKTPSDYVLDNTTMYRFESMLSQDFSEIYHGSSPEDVNDCVLPYGYQWTFTTRVYKYDINFDLLTTEKLASEFIGSDKSIRNGYLTDDVERFVVKIDKDKGARVKRGEGAFTEDFVGEDMPSYFVYTSDNTTGCTDVYYKLTYKDPNKNNAKKITIIEGFINRTDDVTADDCTNGCEEHLGNQCLPYYKLRINHILHFKIDESIYDYKKPYTGNVEWVNLFTHDVDIDIPTN